MTTPPTPYHQAQIDRSLPLWARTLHPEHTRRIVQALRKDYLDENGTPYSWYAAASQDDQALVRQLIDDRDTGLKALRGALKGLKQIHEFCKPLLSQQLGLDVEVDQAQYIHQPYKVFTEQTNPPGLEISLDQPQPFITKPDGPPQPRSLMEAALHNFAASEDAGPYDTLTQGPGNNTMPRGLTPQMFIDQCRALDLGQRYQDHLQAIYKGSRQAEIEQRWIEASRQALKTQAMIAYLKGLLTLKGRDALTQLCDNHPAPHYADDTLHCWRFSLFGIPLNDVLLIGPERSDQANPCMLYIPQDQAQPLREFPSLQKAGAHLRQRLLQSTFRRYLIAFADQDRQAELASKLENALFEQTPSGRKPAVNPNVKFDSAKLSLPIWPVLYRNHTRRLKADARTIAVPTADVDAKARKERLAQWLDAGKTLLNVAAFFVPGLDAVMLGVFAYDIMDSVFTGFEAWEDGDTHEALLQLESLAINAATIGGFAVGAKLLKASGFVDALKSVWKDGRQSLWQPDMRPYASGELLPADAQPNDLGLYEISGKDHVLLEEQLYEVFEGTDGKWRVRHPQNPDAYSPALRYLGDKRWQLDHDDPLEWDESKLLNGLGQFSDGLEPAEQLTALRIAGGDADSLRHSQINGARPPALLADTLLRLRLDNETQSIITRVRHGLPLAAYKNFALPELTNMPGWPARYRLKVFTGPEKWGDAIYFGADDAPDALSIEIGREDLDSGNLSTVVVEQMDEQALQQLLPGSAPEQRARALDEQLAKRLTERRSDVFDSMLKSQQTPPGAAEQTLGRQFPGLPDSALKELVAHAGSSERQRMASGRVPLRVAEEARHLQARARLDRALLGLYRPSLANADSQLLRHALQTAHPQASEAQVLDIALADRPGCAKLLGQQPIKPGFRTPMRLAHGRIGYPLSGRGAASRSAGVAARRLRSLFPTLDSGEIAALQAELSETGNLGSAIGELQKELHNLEHDLNEWIGSAQGLDDRLDRQQCAEQLKRAWRREGGSNQQTLVLERMRLPHLPAIRARMPHIRELKLTELELHDLSEQFLSCFPNLQVLEVTGNPQINTEALYLALRSVPRLRTLDLTSNALQVLSPTAQQVLSAMPDLRQLNLRRNRLTLDEGTLAFLCKLPLDVLRLGSNRITLDEGLAARFQDMVHPQQLDLDFNPLQHAPDVSFMARLRHLDLNNSELLAWPNGLTTLMSQPQYQLRYLDLSFNRIHHIQDLATILRTPYARDVAARLPERNWMFNYNNIEAESSRRLRASGVNAFEHPPERPEWQRFWRDQASMRQDQLWADLFDQNENGDLQGVIERMTDSKEAQSDPEGLRTRVWSLLEQASEDTALRERLTEVAKLYPPTCGDAGAEAFSALEVELLANRAAAQAQGSAKPLVDLYRQLYRREMVNQLADRISLKRNLRKQALQENVMDDELPAYDVLDYPAAFPDVDLETGLVDDIEVRLALRQSLAEHLDFPEPSSGMLFRSTARINQTIIDNVGAAVLKLDADTHARQQWMAGQPVWVDYLKARYASQFEAITDFWRPGVDYLFHCLDEQYEPVPRLDSGITQVLSDAMPDSPLDERGMLRRVPLEQKAFKDAMDALTREQKQVEDGLLLSLTRQVETLDG
ncbi:NEL-type E3 ubiquitin ligase domain-containing protein [Pseudomonas vlassakiae]|uniref:NEL-type E3 ubiquitin ligase domain-containing protein n=1 Tax=Pseudomonas vlassakiae TaxID=485888 RepID=UPI0016737D9A|nr:NEL-type E3 ubiquitin ligase domain-containing protein [Pseudomonas vlassakiae]